MYCVIFIMNCICDKLELMKFILDKKFGFFFYFIE